MPHVVRGCAGERKEAVDMSEAVDGVDEIDESRCYILVFEEEGV